ncbi:MAG: hypothetical protein U0744_10695 [Gemmataceae bacterium]
MSKVRTLSLWLFALALIGFGAEVGARLDDWAFADVPFLATPNRERDLTVHDEHGFHGRPHGRFKKWKLNAIGFRGPEVSDKPANDIRRIMVLGASETIGLYESEGKEYAVQLEAMLKKNHPDVEVVNAAMAGMSLASMKSYWERWASRAEPNVVLIYPSPMFYLNTDMPTAPAADAPAPEDPPISLPEHVRMWPRIQDVIRQSEWLRPMRQARFRWRTEAMLQGKPADWVWSELPKDRLKQFGEDLRDLVRSIRAKRGIPVLITHANRSPHPPTPQDLGELDAMRFFFPRAKAEIITVFEEQARAAVVRIAEEETVRCIDAASKMTDDRKAWFADEVHFTDAGATRFAGIVAGALEPMLTGR